MVDIIIYQDLNDNYRPSVGSLIVFKRWSLLTQPGPTSNSTVTVTLLQTQKCNALTQNNCNRAIVCFQKNNVEKLQSSILSQYPANIEL